MANFLGVLAKQGIARESVIAEWGPPFEAYVIRAGCRPVLLAKWDQAQAWQLQEQAVAMLGVDGLTKESLYKLLGS